MQRCVLQLQDVENFSTESGSGYNVTSFYLVCKLVKYLISLLRLHLYEPHTFNLHVYFVMVLKIWKAPDTSHFLNITQLKCCAQSSIKIRPITRKFDYFDYVRTYERSINSWKQCSTVLIQVTLAFCWGNVRQTKRVKTNYFLNSLNQELSCVCKDRIKYVKTCWDINLSILDGVFRGIN